MGNNFDRLNYQSFEKTLKPHCHGTFEATNFHGKREVKRITSEYLDSKILLISGLDKAQIDRFEYGDGDRSSGIGKDSLSAFRNGNKRISQWILDAYSGKNSSELLNMVSSHFKDELMPFLQGRNSRDVKYALNSIISRDKGISAEDSAEFAKSFTDDEDYVYIAKCFIFAMTRENQVSEYESINIMVDQVLKDIKVCGRSTLLNPLIESIFECAVIGVSDFDVIEYYQEDIIKFVLGVLPVANTLDEEHRKKFIDIRMRALEYEINGEFLTGIAKSFNDLFKKYWLGEKNFKLSNLWWPEDGNTLEVQFKNKIPAFFCCRADALANIKTDEEFGALFGIKPEDLPVYGIYPGKPIGEYGDFRSEFKKPTE